jgi:hypothetical protein
MRWRDGRLGNHITRVQPADGLMRVQWMPGMPIVDVGDTVALSVGGEDGIYKLVWIENPIELDWVSPAFSIPNMPVYVFRPSF